ncbi:polyserase-2 [Drosophila elegans]|uniref:polyserase-2 n=1 Tax=Drosophila elegans TaxID=30023 RepID=UPI001BC863B9|nr:polyserase-2 [Drosophila elegans]
MSVLLSLSLFALVICHKGSAQLLDDKCEKGFDLKEFKTPWMATVYNQNEFICAGTLVHRLFVLTAASCMAEGSQLFVRLGEYDCSRSRCNNVEQYGVAMAVQHRDYNPHTAANNIGLLKLRGEVVYTARIHPICIVLLNDISSWPIKSFRAFGWSQRKTLQAVVLSHRSPVECNQNGKMRNDIDNQICAGNFEADTCLENSGGPLAADLDFFGEKLTVQFGIVSNGSELCNSASLHTDVTAYRHWIYNTVRTFETQGDRVLFEECSSNWPEDVFVRLWEVSLFQSTFTGALITNRFVVTVASAFVTGYTPVKVETKYHERLDVESIHKHPQFKYSAGSSKNDIALLKLAQKVPNSDLVKPICIVLNSKTPRAVTALVDVVTEDFMGVRYVNLNPIDHSACSQKIEDPVEPSQFCVEQPSDFVYESPGSTLGSFQNVSGTDRYLLFGIKSFDKRGVIVYTNIQSYADWLVDTVNCD